MARRMRKLNGGALRRTGRVTRCAARITAVLILTLSVLRPVAADQFQIDCERLTQHAHRRTGTKEFHASRDYVKQRFREIGVDAMVVQPFRTAQTHVQRCEIALGDVDTDTGSRRVLPLHPMRSNEIIPPITPPSGITGVIQHVGLGRPEDYGDRDPHGAIVVMDYHAGSAWRRAFRLGAAVVIFTRGPAGLMHAGQSHHTRAKANFPRYFHDGSGDDLPDGQNATVFSDIRWKPAIGSNVLALIRGTRPRFSFEKDELLVVGAHLDSFGQVPDVSPGARAASNVAALLRLAEHFKAYPPRRDLLLACFDAHTRGQTGAAAFYRALDDKSKLDDRIAYHDSERQFLDDLTALLDDDRPMDQASPVRNTMIRRLKRKSASVVASFNEQLLALRTERRTEDVAKQRLAQVELQIKELAAAKKGWNALRRALQRNELTDETTNLFAQTVRRVRADIVARSDELAHVEVAIDAEARIRDLIGSHVITAHVSLLLGDGSDRFGLMIGGQEGLRSASDLAGLYVKIQSAFYSAYGQLRAGGTELDLFEPRSADGTLSPEDVLWGAPRFAHGGAPAGLLGIYNLAIGTVGEATPREGTPIDTLDRLDVARVKRQTEQVAVLLQAVASEASLSQISSIGKRTYYLHPRFSSGRSHGAVVIARSLIGASETPMPDAVLQLRISRWGLQLSPITTRQYAYDEFRVITTDQNGSFAVGPLQSGVNVLAFGYTCDEQGQIDLVTTLDSSERALYAHVEMERCRHGAIVLPPQVRTGMPPLIMNGQTNARLNPSKSYSGTIDGVTFWFVDRRVSRVKIFGLNGAVMLVNGPDVLHDTAAGAEEHDGYKGAGLRVGTLPDYQRVSMRAGSDLWRIDEARMQVLRSRSIMNSSLEELHGRAEDLLLDSRNEPAVARREALAAGAFLSEGHVYTRVRGIMDDLVHAVLILLALCIPFAFAVERLLVGATNVYRQIAAVTGIFAVTFLLLYFTHPAFAVAKTPAIIFLGFTIVVLASMVIVIIVRKFDVELKILQGLSTSVHAVDVSRFGTILAAVSMGISTMRRRPLRTTMTVVTILLLTFTILCFASFDTRTGVVRLFVGPSPSYQAVQFHMINWASIPESVLDVLHGRWGDRAKVMPRYWVTIGTATDRARVITRADGSQPVAIRGIVGIEPEELSLRRDLAAATGLTQHDLEGKVLMTRAVADRLNVSPDDRVQLSGVTLTVGPVLDPVAMISMKDINGHSVLPVDFTDMSNQMNQTALNQSDKFRGEHDVSQLDMGTWSPLLPDSVVIVSNQTAKTLGGTLRTAHLYVDDTTTARAIADDMARMIRQPNTATLDDGVYRSLLGATLDASNAGDLIFPLLLGGLVVFGTMLGSVSDREREIYSFSALGLAPTHIAGLFFAEAMVYSVIGGLGGYLFAQVTVKTLAVTSAYVDIRVPEMNYSSSNAIITILIVMATVLVSAIIPAIKASKSANPGVMRAWRMPAPQGDTFDITFPFTVSQYDFTGIVSFLREHFDNYTDTGLGVFMAQEARIVRDSDGQLGILAKIALAPFDLGVTQAFELRSAPSELEGIDEVKITLERRSGQPRDWQRLNKVLLNDLRRQFLIWRSLPEETTEQYRATTLKELGNNP
jgi:hypothetical protein